jgi:hypothetical protein
VRALLLITAALSALAGGASANCRQALALGLDVSGSVDSAEYRLQLDGLASALLAPDVQDVLLSTPRWPVRIAIYEWSGPRMFNRRLLVDWTEVSDLATLTSITNRLRETTRRKADPSTALGAAMQYGADLLATQSDCAKRTLDISGDGKSNTGPLPQDIAAPGWLTINGLAVGDARASVTPELGELVSYYHANVLRGPDAFVETALGFNDFREAMRRKLLREIQGLSLAGLDQ